MQCKLFSISGSQMDVIEGESYLERHAMLPFTYYIETTFTWIANRKMSTMHWL